MKTYFQELIESRTKVSIKISDYGQVNGYVSSVYDDALVLEESEKNRLVPFALIVTAWT